MPAERSATRKRRTKETDVSVRLNLDGRGTSEVATGVPFLDHLLSALAMHARQPERLAQGADQDEVGKSRDQRGARHA